MATSGNDTIYGTPGADALDALEGDDLVYGYDGDDTLDGGLGADTLYGGRGRDVYLVNSVRDVIVEGFNEGVDELRTSVNLALPQNVEIGVVTDAWGGTLYGNSEANTLVGGIGVDQLWAGAGDDVIDGGGGDDDLAGGLGNDTLLGGDGRDVIRPGLGHDVVDAGLLFDTLFIDYSSLTEPVIVNQVFRSIRAGDNGVSFTNVEYFDIRGGRGDDHLEGSTRNDTLNGGPGADTMIGGKGFDTYFVDSSRDVIIEVAGANAPDNVYSSVSIVGFDHAENYFLQGSAVKVTGTADGNVIYGTEGHNVLWGGAGGDFIYGGLGDDELAGGEGVDYLIGTDNGDSLALDGNDTLTGGMDRDYLQGGLGADVFRYRAAAESNGQVLPGTYQPFDRISDFSHLQNDVIDLSAIDANRNVAGNQSFTFIGQDAFHGVAGELRQTTYSDTGQSAEVPLLEADTNGDGAADFRIDFIDLWGRDYLGSYQFVSSDFVL